MHTHTYTNISFFYIPITKKVEKEIRKTAPFIIDSKTEKKKQNSGGTCLESKSHGMER
jgi:hypothetical protein